MGGGPDMRMDDPMGGSEEVGRQGGLTFQFTVSVDSVYGDEMLTQRLPEILKDARIYPERIKLFSDVVVGQSPKVQMLSEVTAMGGRRDGVGAGMGAGIGMEPGMGGAAGMGPGREMGESVNKKKERLLLVTNVVAYLRPIEEIMADLEKARREEAEKAKADATGRREGGETVQPTGAPTGAEGKVPDSRGR